MARSAVGAALRDCLFRGIRFNVREDGRIKSKTVYVCYGVNIDGKPDVLGLWIAENEGAGFWLSICNELKNQGVKDILIACVDGLTGLPEAIESVYPSALCRVSDSRCAQICQQQGPQNILSGHEVHLRSTDY